MVDEMTLLTIIVRAAASCHMSALGVLVYAEKRRNYYCRFNISATLY